MLHTISSCCQVEQTTSSLALVDFAAKVLERTTHYSTSRTCIARLSKCSQGWKGQGATLLGAPLKLTNVSKLRCQSGVRNTTCLFQYSAVSSWASKVDRKHPQKLGKRRRKRMSCIRITATIWRMPFKPSVANATRRCTSARWRITLKADINLSSPSTTGSTKIQALNLSRSPITSVSFAGKNWF